MKYSAFVCSFFPRAAMDHAFQLFSSFLFIKFVYYYYFLYDGRYFYLITKFRCHFLSSTFNVKFDFFPL